jgi:hypothetical protein
VRCRAFAPSRFPSYPNDLLLAAMGNLLIDI